MAQADSLLFSANPISDAALHRYWVFSRDLSHQWMQSLAVCQKVLEVGSPQRSRQCWLEYEPEIRDILRADVLQRVWYAILRSADAAQGRCHAEPIARSVLAAQMQTRIRALKLVISGHQFDASRMRALNHLRRSTEEWADFLIAHLAFEYNFTDVLFDQERAQLWSRDPLAQVLPELQIPEPATTLAQLNRELIAASSAVFPLTPLQKLTALMLECFPDSAFDETGSLKK